jgi:hypothetical protein
MISESERNEGGEERDEPVLIILGSSRLRSFGMDLVQPDVDLIT